VYVRSMTEVARIREILDSQTVGKDASGSEHRLKVFSHFEMALQSGRGGRSVLDFGEKQGCLLHHMTA